MKPLLDAELLLSTCTPSTLLCRAVCEQHIHDWGDAIKRAVHSCVRPHTKNDYTRSRYSSQGLQRLVAELRMIMPFPVPVHRPTCQK